LTAEEQLNLFDRVENISPFLEL